jgi:hypothetical protein
MISPLEFRSESAKCPAQAKTGLERATQNSLSGPPAGHPEFVVRATSPEWIICQRLTRQLLLVAPGLLQAGRSKTQFRSGARRFETEREYIRCDCR